MPISTADSYFREVDSYPAHEILCRAHSIHFGTSNDLWLAQHIRVYLRGSEIIDLRIEAKVLLRDGDVAKTYIAANGMGRFSDPDEPYTEHEVGGMLAYTFTDDLKTWTGRIEGGLKGAKPPYKNFSHQIGQASDQTLFCHVPFKSKTGSARTEVLVFHVVLEFDSAPVAR